jgi:hypothetical protein
VAPTTEGFGGNDSDCMQWPTLRLANAAIDQQPHVYARHEARDWNALISVAQFFAAEAKDDSIAQQQSSQHHHHRRIASLQLAAARHARAHGNFRRAHWLLDSIASNEASLGNERRVETALVLSTEGRQTEAIQLMTSVAAACQPGECVSETHLFEC